MEWTRDEFVLTDDSSRFDLERTFLLLQGTYWGVRRPREVVAKMSEHSLCFVLLRGGIQVGFGRAVTDYIVFSWIADIVVDPEYRSQGLGKWIMACIGEHPAIRAHAEGFANARCPQPLRKIRILKKPGPYEHPGCWSVASNGP